MAKLADHEIIPAVLAKIEHIDAKCMTAFRIGTTLGITKNGVPNSERTAQFAKAADRLRDFATVELLCEGLGITRKEIE